RRNIHATRLACPNLASIRPVRLEFPATPSRGIVLLKQRDLLGLRTASRPDTKVNTSISDRTIQRPRQSLVRATFKPLDFLPVRPEVPATPRRGTVLLKPRGLLGLRTASRPDTKVNTRISGRTIPPPRQSPGSATFKPPDFVLVRPRCGKLRRCHKGLLSGIEKAPTIMRGLTKVCGGQVSGSSCSARRASAASARASARIIRWVSLAISAL